MHEKRQHPRVVVDLPVRCEPEGLPAFEAVARDISIGGVFIETEQLPPFGTAIKVNLALPGIPEAQLPGTVRWTNPGGIGVQFGLFGARETHAITTLMRR